MTPSAAASFTLTCKPIWFILGNQSLDRLWARDFEPSRRAFLELLGRDLLYHVVCLYCNQLHRSDRTRHRSLRLSLCGTRPLCEVAEREQNVHRYINLNFSYIQLQSARKLYYSSYYKGYRQKLYSMLSYNEVSICDTYTRERTSYSWLTKSRFLYREQNLLQLCHRQCLGSCSEKDCIRCRGGMKDIVLNIFVVSSCLPPFTTPPT